MSVLGKSLSESSEYEFERSFREISLKNSSSINSPYPSVSDPNLRIRDLPSEQLLCEVQPTMGSESQSFVELAHSCSR